MYTVPRFPPARQQHISTMATALRSTLLRQSLPVFRPQPLLRTQRAAFQTTSIRPILPPLPQKLDGTVNDPVKVPQADPSHGSYHWTAERIGSVALIPLTIAPFAAGALNPMMDGLLIGMVLIHTHLGFDSVITDYAPKWRVPTARKLLNWARNLALVVVGWGWYEFETNDVGLTEGIKRIWRA